MKLTYWKSKCLNDHDAYSIRRKTKKAVLAILEHHQPGEYSAPFKVEVEYKNGFDLMMQCMGNEGYGLCAEWDAEPSDISKNHY